MSTKKTNPLSVFGKDEGISVPSLSDVIADEEKAIVPAKPPKKVKSLLVRIEPQLHKALKMESFETDVSMSEIVEHLLKTRYEKELEK